MWEEAGERERAVQQSCLMNEYGDYFFFPKRLASKEKKKREVMTVILVFSTEQEITCDINKYID